MVISHVDIMCGLRNLIGSQIFRPGSPRNRSKTTRPSPSCGWGLGMRLSPFMRSVITCARAVSNCVGELLENPHTQLHSAHACAITDRVNGDGLGSEANFQQPPLSGDTNYAHL